MTPEAQSSLLPFLCAFFLALVLNRIGERWLGFAIIGGLLLTAALTVGLEFSPLTSTRKIILCSLLLPLLALVLDFLRVSRLRQIMLLMIALAAAIGWVIWPVLVRKDGMEIVLLAAPVVLYVVGVCGGVLMLSRGQSHRESGALIALGLGTGGCSLVAASALYTQLSFAVAAACGGVLLVLLLTKSPGRNLGNLSLYAATVPLALIGAASTVYAKMPSMGLLFLCLIPLFAAIPLTRIGNFWLRSAVSTILGLLPAIPAVWLAWQAAGPVVY